MDQSALVAFYRDTGCDHAGRTLMDILSWDDRRLEMAHDYIQWLFPLPDSSRFNPQAPTLSAIDVQTFRSDPKIVANVHRALDRLLTFWGFQRAGNVICRGQDFAYRSARWLEPMNHNYLRITRVLLFLGHANMTALRSSFATCLEDIALHEAADVIPAQTLSFWRDAAARPS